MSATMQLLLSTPLRAGIIRFFSMLCLSLCITTILCVAALAVDDPVRVFIDGKEAKLNPSAMVRNGKTYVPLRGGAEALGAVVKWDDQPRTATITLGNKRTRIPESKGINVDGRLFLHLRDMGEALNCTVKWDPDARAVRITKEAPSPTGGG